MKYIDGGVCAPKGFMASGMHCGIRKGKNKPDLHLYIQKMYVMRLRFYTTNKVKSAPIFVTQKNLEDNRARRLSATAELRMHVFPTV
jgi:glutamate N-acetyltransferase/amino-acid N-acetyltransferase